MRVQAGLKPEDWTHWGQWTTFKTNGADLVRCALRPHQAIYCSPLTDPYQPAEEQQRMMPEILSAVAAARPRAFVIQTRGPLVLRDVESIRAAGVSVSFSVTTDADDVRRIFEPHCAPIEERWRTIRELRAAGVRVTATLAPLLPCNPELLLERALEETEGAVIGDPFHVRAVKKSGATTRDAAWAICRKHGWEEWLDASFQSEVLERMKLMAERAGRTFAWGPPGFGILIR